MAKSISLDDLIALNDEIAGLVRAGLPLEIGLAGWGRDLSGRLARLVTRISQSIENGQDLGESLAAEREQLPALYQAIVTAGLKAGRLPAALESVSTSARNLREVRAAIGLAVIYPLVLVTLSYFFFLVLLVYVIPAILLLYDSTPPHFWSSMARFGQWATAAIPIPLTGFAIRAAFIPPLLLLVVACVWWLRTRRAILVDSIVASRWLCWVPLAGRVVQHARAASLAEILGLLVENDVPLDEALCLAADCSSDRKLVQSAAVLAARIREGAAPDGTWGLAGFPPLLMWLLSSGGRKQAFVAMAHHVSDTYRRHVTRESQWLRDSFPIWLVALVGGSLLTVYAVSFFVPYTQLLEAIGNSTGQSLRIKP